MRKYTQEKPLKTLHEDLWEFPLSSWAYDIKLRQCILIHQLGFELEIYHQDELSAAYWYVIGLRFFQRLTGFTGHFNGYAVLDMLILIES